MRLHWCAGPVLGDRFELPEIGQADDDQPALLGDADVCPQLHVNLGTLLNSEVMRGPAVAILHPLDAPVVGCLAAHLKVLACQVGLGYAVYHLALGPELGHEISRPIALADAGASTDEKAFALRCLLGLLLT